MLRDDSSFSIGGWMPLPDGTGVLAVLADLRRRDPVTGQARGPVTALQPLELARLQAGPAALRRSEAALRSWEGLLREVPARRFGAVAEQRQPRYWQAFYDSPASYLAVQAVAARTGAGTSTVLLAAYAVALAQVTGSNPAVIQAGAACPDPGGRSAGVTSPMRAVRSVRRCTQ